VLFNRKLGTVQLKKERRPHSRTFTGEQANKIDEFSAALGIVLSLCDDVSLTINPINPPSLLYRCRSFLSD
jgi:hypothetical protein